jgi:hypothetical protein
MGKIVRVFPYFPAHAAGLSHHRPLAPRPHSRALVRCARRLVWTGGELSVWRCLTFVGIIVAHELGHALLPTNLACFA